MTIKLADAMIKVGDRVRVEFWPMKNDLCGDVVYAPSQPMDSWIIQSEDRVFYVQQFASISKRTSGAAALSRPEERDITGVLREALNTAIVLKGIPLRTGQIRRESWAECIACHGVGESASRIEHGSNCWVSRAQKILEGAREGRPERDADQIAIAEAVDESGLTERLFNSGMNNAADILTREAERFSKMNVAESATAEALLRGARLIRARLSEPEKEEG